MTNGQIGTKIFKVFEKEPKYSTQHLVSEIYPIVPKDLVKGIFQINYPVGRAKKYSQSKTITILGG